MFKPHYTPNRAHRETGLLIELDFIYENVRYMRGTELIVRPVFYVTTLIAGVNHEVACFDYCGKFLPLYEFKNTQNELEERP